MNTFDTLHAVRPTPAPFYDDWSEMTLTRIQSGATTTPRLGTSIQPYRRRVVLVAAATAAAIVGLVGTTVSTGSPAFAVDRDPTGDVVVTINRLTDPAGLEEALNAEGIRADVTYLRTSTPLDLDNGLTACTGGETVGAIVGPDEGRFRITLERAYLDSHQGSEMTLTAAGGRESTGWAGVSIKWSDGRC